MSSSKPAPAKDPKKQSTLNGFFTKKPGPAPSRTGSSGSITGSTTKTAIATSSPSSTTLKTPSSVSGSSPMIGRGSATGSKDRARGSSPLKRPTVAPKRSMDVDEDDEVQALSPPPRTVQRTTSTSSMRIDPDEEDDGQDVQMEGSPPVKGGRRQKRKIVYAESDESGSDAGAGPSKAKEQPARKPRKSLKVDSDDDFEIDGDDAFFAAAAEELDMAERSSPDIRSASPEVSRAKKPVKKTSSFVAPAKAKTSTAGRPGPHPITNTNKTASSSSSFQNSSNMFLTAAETRKAKALEEKKESDEVFSFLKDPKDKQGRRPDDPDYDPRTIYIPAKTLRDLKPFEKQFWTIKQDHYDTVLFFQKGKFFELYEDDAQIGHQEFDLKLTERVRMKMVGVPEQSFDFWASKFLAAGYKVGRVDQVETAIGAEMRRGAEQKAGGKGKAPVKKKKSDEGDDDDKPDKIVRRELKQVFTNGTIVDGNYLTTDEANHCVAIKEYSPDPNEPSSFGICMLDASTGEFSLVAFEDDVCRTKLQTMFRQIRPKELVHEKGNLSVTTIRTLRNILPSSTLWQSFRPNEEFCSADETLVKLAELFETEDDEPGSKAPLPPAIEAMLGNPLAMEALGGLIFYLRTLNLDKDLITQRNFNVYEPIREGKSLVLDGQTLGHMEVLINNEGELAGTLLEILQLCVSPFGKRLFRIWLTSPLREIPAINARLDAVEDLMKFQSFTGQFTQMAKALPDLERLISRIHAGSIKHTDFVKVVQSFEAITKAIDDLSRQAADFDSTSISSLLRSAPDLKSHVRHMNSMFIEKTDGKTMSILPVAGADKECDEANAAVKEAEDDLNVELKAAQRMFKGEKVEFWHSAQGGKEIFQLQVPANVEVPRNWTKQSSTKNFNRYYTPKTIPLIRVLQEARETEGTAKKTFFLRLLGEFDKDREVWLAAVKIIAELDCLVSLAKASATMDEPKCRPEFISSDTAFIDFQELRHPSMCLRSDFIANNVRLGGEVDGEIAPRQVLLTGPNMAGKSTLLRMTAAGIIMAQLGCYVPARRAVLSPVDKIQTRMGAHDNMFASASTFKVELDECCKILREAGPKSFVILDELGRGTSTYDGMAIAGAVLHHLATHTLPLGFFATHYGSLTDDFAYHPNVRRMHMQTHVDDEQRQVVFLYKLIPGVAESSHGTHVARLAGVPEPVVVRADQVSAEFFAAFKTKLAAKRRSDLPLLAHADFAWLVSLLNPRKDRDGRMVVDGNDDGGDVIRGNGIEVGKQLDIIRRAIGQYEQSI